MSENDNPIDNEKDLISSIEPTLEESVIDDSSGIPVLPLRDVAPELNLIAQLKAVAAQPITVLN